jgi:hypothetical protein
MGTVVYAAGSGYVPPSSPSTVPAGVAGGFTHVLISKTISISTTTTTTIDVSVLTAPTSIAIAPHTFSVPVQVVVTAPNLTTISATLPKFGLSGYRAIGGLGLSIVTPTGQLYPGSFRHPITLSVTNSAIQPGDRVVEWNAQGQFLTVANATITPGHASWSVQSDPAFAILAPEQTAVVPKATSPVTGKPFLAAALVGLGALAAGIAVIRSRRT